MIDAHEARLLDISFYREHTSYNYCWSIQKSTFAHLYFYFFLDLLIRPLITDPRSSCCSILSLSLFSFWVRPRPPLFTSAPSKTESLLCTNVNINSNLVPKPLLEALAPMLSALAILFVCRVTLAHALLVISNSNTFSQAARRPTHRTVSATTQPLAKPAALLLGLAPTAPLVLLGIIAALTYDNLLFVLAQSNTNSSNRAKMLRPARLPMPSPAHPAPWHTLRHCLPVHTIRAPP